MTALQLPQRIAWPWDQEARRVGFWRDFTYGEGTQAQLYVACSSVYRVWLDGVEMQLPVSHLPSWRSMHIFAVSLAPGPHRLCFEVDNNRVAQPFLLANLDWRGNGQLTRMATDANWSMANEPAPGWGDSGASIESRPAWAFDGVWAEPWGMPCNAPDDFCRLTTGWQILEEETLTRTAQCQPGLVAAGSRLEVRADGSILFNPPEPYPLGLPRLDLARPRLEWYRTREAHSLINNTWLDLFEQRCPYVIFDAGAETFARLRLRLRGGGLARLAVTTGESLNEVNRYARRVTDLVELRDGESFATAPTGFRFVKVMALSAGVVELDPVEIQHVRYPVGQQGEFHCSDGELNSVFELSVRTLHLCMQNEIWDGIKRDQLPWMGDLYTEVLAAYLLFGDHRLARRSLAVLAEVGPAPRRPLEEQLYPGLQSIWGSGGGDINDIPAYTLWWVVGLWDYWLYSGDRSLIVDLGPVLKATLEHLTSWVDADGFWRLKAGWDFVDWAPLKAEERAVYSHLLACRALELGLRLLDLIGLPTGAGWNEICVRMASAARRAWGADGAGFGPSHHTNAQAICSGILSAEESADVFERNLEPDPELSMTYWHRFLDLAAAQKVGKIDWGLAYIRRHWGHALKIGATTLWEAFDPTWIGDDPHAVSMVGAGYARYGGYETSLCHGWSSGPAAWLLSAVLGIAPEEPGFARVRFEPNLGGLEWAEGSVPTPQGMVRVNLRRRPGQKSLAILHLPEGVRCRLADQLEQEWEIRQVSAGLGD
jgi:alpha-L-rhamnosidase